MCSDDEVEARLGAIRPSIAAGLIGENVSGSSKAMRNVACHNFQIEVNNLSPLDAKRIQRGGRKRAATREAIKEETDPLCEFMDQENEKISQFRFKWISLVSIEVIHNPKHV